MYCIAPCSLYIINPSCFMVCVHGSVLGREQHSGIAVLLCFPSSDRIVLGRNGCTELLVT